MRTKRDATMTGGGSRTEGWSSVGTRKSYEDIPLPKVRLMHGLHSQWQRGFKLGVVLPTFQRSRTSRAFVLHAFELTKLDQN